MAPSRIEPVTLRSTFGERPFLASIRNGYFDARSSISVQVLVKPVVIKRKKSNLSTEATSYAENAEKVVIVRNVRLLLKKDQ